ncbi:MAG: hypothetical protein LBM65_04855 [Oscillospiraceae bacterium]|jgi:hypothetical protein|nr:hypothetical protein [Oscillospiraceae bacterium]
MRKPVETKISSVMYSHIGKDKDFNTFLKTVICDYVSLDKQKILSKEKYVASVNSEKSEP